jgi:hypothetical protein
VRPKANNSTPGRQHLDHQVVMQRGRGGGMEPRTLPPHLALHVQQRQLSAAGPTASYHYELVSFKWSGRLLLLLASVAPT